MEQNKQSMTNPEQEPTFSVITVPEHLREQVLEHVKQLADDESDVSGYMMGLSSHSLTSSLMARWSGTGCSTWDSKGSMDMGCSDTD
ncbi:MAG: hypothetical protein WBW04_21125 [Nitrolancea sp.]